MGAPLHKATYLFPTLRRSSASLCLYLVDLCEGVLRAHGFRGNYWAMAGSRSNRFGGSTAPCYPSLRGSNSAAQFAFLDVHKPRGQGKDSHSTLPRLPRRSARIGFSSNAYSYPSSQARRLASPSATEDRIVAKGPPLCLEVILQPVMGSGH